MIFIAMKASVENSLLIAMLESIIWRVLVMAYCLKILQFYMASVWIGMENC